MQVSCPRCDRVLDYSGDRPRFCAFCGLPLESGFGAGSGSGAAADSPAAGSDPVARLLATAEYDGGPNSPMPRTPGGSGLATEDALSRRGGGFGNRPEAPPERVASYKIIRLLGRGGMGSVYEAEDDDGRRVALKLIAADHVTSTEAVERFRQEGRLASTLAHPRCVFVLGADEHDGRPYIVMELMPGETLQTRVEAGGPLPVAEAVAKLLDVIEGLQEAHLSGVIHRDVKPSNCFLESDGRVKVGDFGLSKSLEGDAGLTRTGSFVGTPLFASPEQIKRDAVDARTDVYSTAATLYYVLTGKPPFEAGDAAATLAKIVSEPPRPPRQHRPDLPRSLEAVLLRGLERDRDRRYADLARFREALLPFVSDQLRLADLALRVSAFFGDTFVLILLQWTIVSVAIALTSADSWRAVDVLLGRFSPLLLAAQRLALVAYFAAPEGLCGWSPGKRLTGLRVRSLAGGGPPGGKVGLTRALAFYAVAVLPFDAATVVVFRLMTRGAAARFEPFVVVVMLGLGLLAAASTMRAGNGYRGIHELLSGTRVVRLAHSGRLRAPRGRRLPARADRARDLVTKAAGVQESVGPFKVRGAVRWEPDRRVLMGEDPGLKRPVWIVFRPRGSPPPPQARRDLGRPARPRWLAGGEQAEGRWDAYAAPAGCPLSELAGADGLAWADARPILHELADELARASAEGTLPETLSVEQVWVQPDGAVQLVDPLGPSPGHAPPAAGHARALELLRQTAALALQGGRGRGRRGAPGSAPGPIRAAVPGHAGRMLDRLIGRPREGDPPYTDLAALVADFEADRDRPTEVDVFRRTVHLVPASAALALPLALMIASASPWGLTPRGSAASIGVAPLVWVVWAALTRGGFLLGLAGLALVRHDGRPAEWWRCGWRALVVWSPVAALLFGAWWAREYRPASPSLAWGLWDAAVVALLLYPVLALVRPARSAHDHIAGTWVVPR